MWYSCGVMLNASIPDDVLRNPVELSSGVRIEVIPQWVKDPRAVEHERRATRSEVESAVAAFVVEYEGTPGVLDKWQKQAEEKIFLAGIALWMAKPTGWSAGHMFHFQEKGDAGSWRRSGPINRLLVDREYLSEYPDPADFETAAEILTYILNLKRSGAVWGSIRFLGMALSERLWEPRFVLI